MASVQAMSIDSKDAKMLELSVVAELARHQPQKTTTMTVSTNCRICARSYTAKSMEGGYPEFEWAVCKKCYMHTLYPEFVITETRRVAIEEAKTTMEHCVDQKTLDSVLDWYVMAMSTLTACDTMIIAAEQENSACQLQKAIESKYHGNNVVTVKNETISTGKETRYSTTFSTKYVEREVLFWIAALHRMATPLRVVCLAETFLDEPRFIECGMIVASRHLGRALISKSDAVLMQKEVEFEVAKRSIKSVSPSSPHPSSVDNA